MGRELGALSDRKVTALLHSLQLFIGATSMREALATPGSTASGRREDSDGSLHAFLDHTLHPRRLLHDGPLVEWLEVLAVMADPHLAEIDADLCRAEDRFTALLEPHALSPEFLSLLKGEKRFASDGRDPIKAEASRTEAAVPAPVEPMPKSTDRLRRFMPLGLGDPEWRIAPLTGAERRAAASYVRSILADTQLTAHWSDAARRALLTAVESYDMATRRTRRPRARSDDVRLDVFLDAWRAASARAVRRV
jgi:hypothetical protein